MSGMLVLCGAVGLLSLWLWRQAVRDADALRAFVVLRLLRDRGESYGLDLVAESGGVLRKGLVYVTLYAMEEEGLITSRVEQGGTGRRLYRLADAPAPKPAEKPPQPAADPADWWKGEGAP